VTIIGPENLPATLAFNASQLYSKNITTFLDNLWTKGEEKTINREDDIVQGTLVTFGGELVNPRATEWIGGKQ
jgi:NAD(P) transhydrogenase subunit alpha